jgi:hypothetical protein
LSKNHIKSNTFDFNIQFIFMVKENG